MALVQTLDDVAHQYINFPRKDQEPWITALIRERLLVIAREIEQVAGRLRRETRTRRPPASS
jgi:hypothetical protein